MSVGKGGFVYVLPVYATAGRLSGLFPYFAGINDVFTGTPAIPVARLAMFNSIRANNAVAEWNSFGALDLFVALGPGIT
jgi:hypothetical protein